MKKNSKANEAANYLFLVICGTLKRKIGLQKKESNIFSNLIVLYGIRQWGILNKIIY